MLSSVTPAAFSFATTASMRELASVMAAASDGHGEDVKEAAGNAPAATGTGTGAAVGDGTGVGSGPDATLAARWAGLLAAAPACGWAGAAARGAAAGAARLGCAAGACA